MQLALPVLLLAAAAHVAQGDAADVRGLLRARVKAKALQGCGSMSTGTAMGGNDTLCMPPQYFAPTQYGGCAKGVPAIYVLQKSSNPYQPPYVQVCGAECTYTTTVPVPASVGGVSCNAGNVNVAIPGVTNSVIFNSPNCVPCSDAPMCYQPTNEAAAIGCSLANAAFGEMVAGTVGVANTIASGTVNLANSIASGTVILGNTIDSFTMDVGDIVVDVGNDVGDFVVDVADDVDDFFKGWGR
jgi:hypothetical protein